MSPMFDKINEYYHLGLWDIEKVRKAVRQDRITTSEFKEITGQNYR